MAELSFTDREHPPVILDGSSLTTRDVAAIARDGAAAVLSSEARARNDLARHAIAVLLARGDELYGVTTGVGALRAYRVPEDDRERYGLNLLRSHACGAGVILTVPVVRAAMATRANQIGAGGAGVANELLDDPRERAQRGPDAVHARARVPGNRRSHQPRRRRAGPAR